MLTHLLFSRRRAGIGLLAGLCLATSGVSLAQEAPTASAVVPVSPTPAPGEIILDKGGPQNPSTPPATTPAQPCPEKPAAEDKAPPSVWSKVPPACVFPRPGLFLVPPAGSGYYSLLDFLRGDRRKDAPKYGYPRFALMPPSFFDADFRYLGKPDNKDHDPFDPLKRVHAGDDWLLSFGGQNWLRYMNEVNSRLTNTDNTYYLLRTRAYGDLWYRDRFRLYVEYLDAHSFEPDLPPLATDVDRSDFLNLFVDVKLFDVAGKPVYVRGGRQELLYGSQRLIAPPDWLNTRRTFEGVKVFRPGDKFDVDAWWVQPVVPHPSHLDSADHQQNFTGLWTTYRPKKGTFIDLYYLNLDNDRPVAVGRGGVRGGFNVSTFGGRFAGDCEDRFLWDAEAMYQLGDWSNQLISAGAYSVGLGYHFKELPMGPQFWVYNDGASGNHNPGATRINGTFNQLFPFGHYYFGYLDLVGRRNINDFNLQYAFYPTKWVTVLSQYHRFRLDSAKDALYNAAGVATRRDPTGRAGGDVGQEFDFYVDFHLGEHTDVLFGYSKLFAGDFLKRTGNPDSPELTYLMYNFRW